MTADPLSALLEGDLTTADREFVDFAEEAERRGRPAVAARARATVAGLRRVRGDLDGAAQALGSAPAGGDPPAWRAEAAELALAAGDVDGAARHLDAVAGGVDAAMARRLARLRARVRGEASERDLLAVLPVAGRAELAQIVRGVLPTPDWLVISDDERAEWACLAPALLGGDPSGVQLAATELRSAALEGRWPAGYALAALLDGFASDRLGDRARAYATLATAAATLADILGRTLAASMVEPALAYLRDVWGEDEFSAVKTAHDERRRQDVRA